MKNAWKFVFSEAGYPDGKNNLVGGSQGCPAVSLLCIQYVLP